MNCPNCNKVMKEKEYFALDFGYGMAGEEVYNRNIEFKCSSCKIMYENDKWIIPDKLQPTEKQKKTLSFINNRLGTDFEPITKHQCWNIINENLNKANNVKPSVWYSEITDEDCYVLGLDESMFC